MPGLRDRLGHLGGAQRTRSYRWGALGIPIWQENPEQTQDRLERLSLLPWECLSVPGQLEVVGGEREAWLSLLKLLPMRSDGWMYIRILNNPLNTSIMIQYADWFFLEDVRLKGYSQRNNQLRRRKIWSIWKQFKHLKTTQLTWFGKWSDADSEVTVNHRL